MYFTINGFPLYCYTAGKALDVARPTVVFIHGVLNDHSVWALQSRYFAHHGWNVLALDLPGHCRSAGPPAATVQAAAAVVLALLDAAGVRTAALVGHSFGSLVALAAAAAAPERVQQLVLVGTAHPMKVSPALLEMARTDPQQAITMVNVFSRATLAAPPSTQGPGTWVYGASYALGLHVLRSNPAVNLLHTGFLACDGYTDGEAAMAQVRCPTLLVLGERDQMTPPKAAQGLLRAAAQAQVKTQVVMLPSGHHQMAETPDAMLQALIDFLPSAPSLAATDA